MPAVWAGDRMIIWGGYGGSGVFLSTGASYSPTSDAWTVLPSSGLSGRADIPAVWTGSEMLIWGGYSGYYSDGARYSPPRTLYLYQRN